MAQDSSPAAWLPQPQAALYRHALDVLLDEHTRAPSMHISSADVDLVTAVWGLTNQVYRHAAAGRLLIDQNFGHEANVFGRTVLEHALVAHWLVVKGIDGLQSFLADKAKRNEKWIESAQRFWKFSPEVVNGFAEEAAAWDETKALRNVHDICQALDVEAVYDMYGFSSNYVHPSVLAIKSFITKNDATGHPIGVKTPLRDSGEMALALLTASVLWAESALDRLRSQDSRFESHLAPLAAGLGFKASLPFPPGSPTPRATRADDST